MKKQLSFIMVLAGGFLLLNHNGLAAEKLSPRDAVDTQLMPKGAWAGALPPTGSQTLAAAPASRGNNTFVNPTYPFRQAMRGIVTKGSGDHEGFIYQWTGTPSLTRQGSSETVKIQKGTVIQVGDTITTGQGSTVSMTFDHHYGNVMHVSENSTAEIRSLEPTDIRIKDGTVYSFLDSLPKNSSWQVSSPTVVAAVRGTYFVVTYTAANGQFFTATLEVPNDDHESLVKVIDVKDGSEGASADVPEGFEMNLKEGQEPDPALLEKINPELFKAIQKILEDLALLRGGEPLPPTNGEFTEPGTLDPAGPDTFGGGPNDHLDPLQDTGSIGEPFLPQEESSYKQDTEPEREGNDER